MATVTVSASTTYNLVGHAADDDIVITGAATLTVNADPTGVNAPRSIRSSSPRATFKVRNSATAFTAGNLWKLSFTNPGSAIGSGNATLGFTGGATMDFEGEWLTCYTATGVASETVLDASNVLGVDIDFPYFIEAETAVGSGVYKAVPVGVIGTSGNGYLTTVDQTAFGTGDVGRVLFYNHSTRLLKTGDGTNGSLFASGIKFRIPNIYVHMPAFTMAVGVGGWTTATGSQNVTSSTNAPTLAAGNVNYTAGVECFNISALPTGTTVTVNNRASDGTTATAFTAGTLIYALPHVSAQMAGRVSVDTNGIFRSKKCMFGRWLMPRIVGGATWDMEDTGFVSEVSGTGVMFNGMNGLSRAIRGVAYGHPGRGFQVALRAGGQAGEIYIDGVLNIAQCSTAATFSYLSNSIVFQAQSCYSLRVLSNVRVWRIGMTVAMAQVNGGVLIRAATPSNNVINGIESVSCTIQLETNSVVIKNVRYSQTNGAASTAGDAGAIQIGQAAAARDVVLYDFDVINGGLAPYGSWINYGAFCTNVIAHNKISGTPRTIDCQARTQFVINPLNGSSCVASAMTFTNLRGTGLPLVSGFAGLGNTVRNVRSAMTSTVVQGQGLQMLDFPGGPQSGNGINSYSDGGTFYAAPTTWPSLVGGIYLGPVSREQNLDQYDLTAGAYTNNAGDFFIETTGDVVLFKSPRAVTGVSSITGGAVVYTRDSSITTGVTAEFRLCKWGDDITAVSWGSFTGGNVQTAFNALSGYTSSIGLNVQLRFTATTTVAGRYIRQCYVPCQMDTAYNPAVGSVNVTAIGAANGGLMAVYDGSSVLRGTATIASGTGTVAGPYDFDGTNFTYTLKIRALQAESIDITSTYGASGALVPAPMAALSGYVAGPYSGASFNKASKLVTVTSNMTTAQLWSAWREYIVQLVNFDTADVWSYPDLDLGDWDITVNGADLTGDLTTTGDATQVSGGRFIGVVQAGNGSSGVLTVSGLTAAQVYVEDAAGVQQSFSASVTGTFTYPTPFGSSGTWRLVVNKPGYYPQVFGFNPQISNSYSVALLPILNPDGTVLYTGGTWPIVVTFDVPANCVATFATQVSVQALFDALQDAYSTADGMAWLANDNAESTAAIQATGHVLNLTQRTRLAGSGAPAAVSGYVTSQDNVVLDPASAFPIRYAQSPNEAWTEELETGFDAGRILRIVAAAVAGKTTGGPSGFTARDLSDAENMIVGTATADGNRTPTSYGS